MDVSVVVVNYNSGPYLLGCLESLARHRPAGELEVVVVDNASPLDQTEALRAAEEGGARVVRQEHNTGYAGGCNRGLAETSGRIVLFLNADVVACEGTLDTLARHLDEHPEAGLVEPRTFLDDDRAFLIPQFFLLTPSEVVREALGKSSGRYAERLSLRRTRRTLASWRATEPLRQDALTGAFLAGRREVLEELCGFDESFPLCFEDWDLFRRVQASGRGVFLVPGAAAIHYGHRSTATVWDEAMAKAHRGRALYLEKHHGRAARWLDACCARLAALRSARPRRRLTELGPNTSPPVLALEGPAGPYLLELALDPFFHLAAGHFGAGTEFAMSEATWRSLPPVPLFLRALDAETLAPRGAWSVQRS